MDFTYANTKTHNNHKYTFISKKFLSPVLRTETKSTHGKRILMLKSFHIIICIMSCIISIAGHTQMSFGPM